MAHALGGKWDGQVGGRSCGWRPVGHVPGHGCGAVGDRGREEERGENKESYYLVPVVLFTISSVLITLSLLSIGRFDQTVTEDYHTPSSLTLF